MQDFMYKLISLFLIPFIVSCGGASAQSSITSLPALGGADDGYSKALTATRDVRSASGGQVGHVNAAFVVHTLSGLSELAFEWASLHILDNNSEAGENVATYSQANALSTGPTWAAVSEVTDTLGKARALIAHEFNTFVTGPDNGNRIGLDVLSGDSRYIRGLGKSAQADASIAIRIGQTSTTPDATWAEGLRLQANFSNAPIKIVAPDGSIVFEIQPNGDIYRRGVLLP